MAGVAGAILRAELGQPQEAAPKDADGSFAKRFQADSAEAGGRRHLSELQARAERLYMLQEWDAALKVFEELANEAQSLKDRAAEAAGVLGLAECLSKPDEVDVELVCGMYSYAREAGKEVGDEDVEFAALVGTARLQQVIEGKAAEALNLWEQALTMARAKGDGERTAFALTQLGLLLLRDPHSDGGKGAGVEVVDESKEVAGHLGQHDRAGVEGEEQDDAGLVQVHQGAAPGAVKAVRLLAEAVSLLPASATPLQQAKARLNLAHARLAHGGRTGQKRQAEQELVAVIRILEEAGGNQELLLRTSAELVELCDENSWLADTDEAKARLAACQSRMNAAQKASANVMSGPRDPEEREAMQRAVWAKQKQAELAAEAEASASDDDDDDEPGLAKPKGDGWQI